MNIGKLYEIKEYFWMIYPSKDIGDAAYDAFYAADAAEDVAAYYSKHFKCNVSYISPNSIFCLLEQDGEFIKVLTTNGELGWFYLADWCKDDIEEVNQ